MIYCRPIQRAFENIGFAKTSTSAADAQRLGYLQPTDAVHDESRAPACGREGARAAAGARRLSAAGSEKAIPVGGDTVSAPLKLGVHLAHRAGRISDHDALIGRKLATIMAGGLLPNATSSRSSTCSTSSAKRS
jgi:3-hydroxyacyl-CoA dehydrogenase